MTKVFTRLCGIIEQGQRAGDADGRIEGTGTIEVVEMDVASLIPARVSRVLVDEGQSVRAGEPLSLLTQAATSSEVEVRRGALQRAEAVLRDLEAGARPAEVRQSAAEVTAAEAEAARLARDYRRQAAASRGRGGAREPEVWEESRPSFFTAEHGLHHY